MGELNIDNVPADQVVPVAEGPQHGYFGYTPDDTPNEDYTVAGVTKAGTARLTDKPDTAAEARTKANTAALKGSK